MTRADDVAAAVDAGVDAVGFVTAAGSPRRVTAAQAAILGRDVAVTRVLVTVGETPEALLAAAGWAGVDGVQPGGAHAADAAAAAADAGYFVLRPVAVGDEAVDLDGIPPGEIPLLDTGRAGLAGGTGQTFDWALAAGIARRFVLAGGLAPDNVAAAVAAAGPWGVDASSRLERVPGRKDHDLVRTFVEEAKKA